MNDFISKKPKRNEAIRKAMKQAGVTQWELADAIGCSEITLCKRLRHELPASIQNEWINIIHEIGAQS